MWLLHLGGWVGLNRAGCRVDNPSMRFSIEELRRSVLGLEPLEGRALLSVVPPFVGPQAGMLTPIVVPAEPVAGGANVTAQNWQRLIRLDEFRADSRFAGIDGSGFATVVIDGGADLDHSFFGPDGNSDGVADRIVYQHDFADNDANASDVADHGSNVASIVGSQDATYSGVAPGVSLIILKVFTDAGSGNFSMVERALRWVVTNAAAYHVSSVNLSLGDNQNHADHVQRYGIGDELDALAAMDVKVLASAGNSFYTFNSQPGVAYPAADPNVIGVGAVFDSVAGSYRAESGATAYTNSPDQIAPFSQRGESLSSIFAPGVYLTGANHNGGVVTMSGTSQASPVIAGLAALADSLAFSALGRKLTLGEFRSMLTTTAVQILDGDDENDNVDNTNLRFGRVDVMGIGEAILAMADQAAPNRAPTLTEISPLTRAVPARPYVVTYERLLAASNAGDADGDAIQLVVTSVVAGSLYKDGVAVVPGVTSLLPGQYLVWKPSTVVVGRTDAFTVRAFDGSDLSVGDVTVAIVSGPTVYGITSALDRQLRGQPAPTGMEGERSFLSRDVVVHRHVGRSEELGGWLGGGVGSGWAGLVGRGAGLG